MDIALILFPFYLNCRLSDSAVSKVETVVFRIREVLIRIRASALTDFISSHPPARLDLVHHSARSHPPARLDLIHQLG
jgi:hypothetical protein